MVEPAYHLMRKLTLKLSRSTIVRKTVKFLRLHLLANWWLHRFPVVKTMPGSGIRYRARRVESLGLSVEMLDEGTLYPAANMLGGIRTFADLGCNAGYFTCWLCHQLKSTQLKGLMVDAHTDAIEDARWHVAANNLRDVHVLHGLVGTRGNGGQADFFMHASSVVSTATPPDISSSEANTWTQIQVPCIGVEENWTKHFGNEPCDLLKIDIEGSEMDFFRNEPGFLQRVQTILIEWHKERVSRGELEKFLSQQGFSPKSILHENAVVGTAIFSRKQPQPGF
jgi:FkbM family methyltransferase